MLYRKLKGSDSFLSIMHSKFLNSKILNSKFHTNCQTPCTTSARKTIFDGQPSRQATKVQSLPCCLGWPMLWRITAIYEHNEGLWKWVNFAPIFFRYELLPTTSGPQKFPKIRFFKVNFFHLSMHITNELWKFGNISIQKLICISDYTFKGPFLEKYFSENWIKCFIL